MEPQFKVDIKMGQTGKQWGSDELSLRPVNDKIEIQIGKNNSTTKGFPVTLAMSKDVALEFARDILSACIKPS